MKLLQEEFLYAIKVDYYMFDGEKEYTKPLYLAINTKKNNLIVFKEDITGSLRVFDTERDASEYIKTHLKRSCSCENPRVVKVKYDFTSKVWKEF